MFLIPKFREIKTALLEPGDDLGRLPVKTPMLAALHIADRHSLLKYLTHSDLGMLLLLHNMQCY